MRCTSWLSSIVLALAACGHTSDDNDDDDTPTPMITTVTLTFAPADGSTRVWSTYDDPDGPGGEPPTVGPINLDAGRYTLTLSYQDQQFDPPTEITDQIRAEGDQHQIFFTGTGVRGPASDQPIAPLMQAYADQDVNGLPIGLTDDVVASPGTGTMTVTLRKLAKTATAAADVKAGGLGVLGGATTIEVDFAVHVQAPSAQLDVDR